MKKSILSLILILFISINVQSQIHLEKKWDRTFGGTDVEALTNIIETTDGGFLLGGHTNSIDTFDVSEAPRGGNDFWVVRTDSLGNKLWDKRFGGSFEDKLYSIFQTYDGGFILGGLTTSDIGGDISEPTRGGMDYWIVKIDDNGTKQWDKRYGGSEYDWLTVVQQTPDSGYILGGWSFSDSSGDKTENKKNSDDFWVVKVNSTGVKQWDRTLGGNQADQMLALQQTSDGGYLLGGKTVSDIGDDISQTGRGEFDFWVIKINSSGTKIWDKRYGGDNREILFSMQQTNEGGYILGGYTRSDNNGDVTEQTRDTSTSLTTNRGDCGL